MRYAVVDDDGNVTNVVVWDGDNAWKPPEGLTAVQAGDTAGPVVERGKAGDVTDVAEARWALLPDNVSPGGRITDGGYQPPPEPEGDDV